ncbi:hypothetical protein PAPHI01_1344 [Pancytospora philotis]|nr:hypothetical protein PAPHI01_1344 [Pancytospora philotis]
MRVFSGTFLLGVFVFLLNRLGHTETVVRSYDPTYRYKGDTYTEVLARSRAYQLKMELADREVDSMLHHRYTDEQEVYLEDNHGAVTAQILSKPCRSELYRSGFEDSASSDDGAVVRAGVEEYSADPFTVDARELDGVDLLNVMGKHAAELITNSEGRLADIVVQDLQSGCEYKNTEQHERSVFHKHIIRRYHDISGAIMAMDTTAPQSGVSPSYKYYFSNEQFNKYLAGRTSNRRNKAYFISLFDFDRLRGIVAATLHYEDLSDADKELFGRMLFARNTFEMYTVMRALGDLYGFKFGPKLSLGKFESAMYRYMASLSYKGECEQAPATITNLIFGIEIFSQAYINCHQLDINIDTRYYGKKIKMGLKRYMATKAPAVVKAIIVMYRTWSNSPTATLTTPGILHQERVLNAHIARHTNRAGK